LKSRQTQRAKETAEQKTEERRRQEYVRR